MRLFLLTALLSITLPSFGQSNNAILTMDFVKVKNGKHQEALYFYENNWKVYRDMAMQKGYIKSYRLVTTSVDSLANFDIILMTEYADSTQMNRSEARFQQIIKEVRPTGPKLLNELKPNDFRQNLFLRRAETIFQSSPGRNKQ
ncbi:MAG TPA: hypothetical protein VD794_03570 [Flavisolibacter sp.]|nr:hypothetical protein [Flavisolibacter sp.]